MTTNNLLLALLLSTAAPAFGVTEQWAVKPEQSPVSFLAVGKPGFLKITGEGARLEGTATLADGKLTGTFDVTLDSLVTGIELRDKHMKETYLQTAAHPKARLVLDPVAVDPAGWRQEKDFTGKLTLKGVEKPVAGKLTVAFEGEVAKATASFQIQLSDYPIGVPSHLGVTVAEKVDIKVEAVAGRGGRS